MHAQTLTPSAIFGNQVRYVVPLFQRPYVWTLEDQWEPLWQDVRTVAEQLLELSNAGTRGAVPPHFLGAIVLDQVATPTRFITVRHIVDGQQRLTTLQLLLDAAQLVAERHGHAMDANALRVLVLNESNIAEHGHEVFKVWPTDRDQAAFRAAMTNDAPVPASLASAQPAKAHAHFVDAISKWADVGVDPQNTAARLTALTHALRDHLKMVVIDLEPTDNAQVIFETLNHRGAPLLAADLIKNLIFQVAEADGMEVERLYRQYWEKLDSDYWRQRIARGRQYVPRIDIFVNYWLVMRLLKEVPTDRIFAEFRDHLFRAGPGIEALLSELARDAVIYESMDRLPASSVIGRFKYRVLQAMDSSAVTPFLLWIMRWSDDRMPPAQRKKALESLESWLVRRALCRLTSKEVTRLVMDLLRSLDKNSPERSGDVVETFLLDQTAETRFWPSDAMVKEALADALVYKTLVRSRLRMLLEAFEDSMRSDKSEELSCPRNLTVEHIMPQAWREHWSDDSLDEVAAVRRDGAIQTLGNLTLVTHKLNPALSNRPWTATQAKARGLSEVGKRDELLKHSVLKLNADVVATNPDSWSESSIKSRTTALADVAVSVWIRPTSRPAPPIALASAEKDTEVAAEEEEPQDGTVEVAGKYRPLAQWLQAQTADFLPATFDELEDILGFTLPASARKHLPYWYSAKNSLGKAVVAGGYRATGVNLADEKLIFKRQAAQLDASQD